MKHDDEKKRINLVAFRKEQILRERQRDYVEQYILQIVWNHSKLIRDFRLEPSYAQKLFNDFTVFPSDFIRRKAPRNKNFSHNCAVLISSFSFLFDRNEKCFSRVLLRERKFDEFCLLLTKFSASYSNTIKTWNKRVNELSNVCMNLSQLSAHGKLLEGNLFRFSLVWLTTSIDEIFLLMWVGWEFFYFSG